MGITSETLLEIFATYNAQIWPMQIVAYLLGIGLFLAIRKNGLSNRIIPVILAFFWLWVAFMFWLPAGQQGFWIAYPLLGIFVIQGLLFLGQVLRPRLGFGFQANLLSWSGIFFVLYALIGYPLFGMLIGHNYPQAPPFGLTPCPLVAYTFGLLLLSDRKVPKTLLVIPLFYALSGFIWVAIGIVEDTGMILSGLLGVWLIWRRDARPVAMRPVEPTPTASMAGWSLDLSDKE